MLLRRHPFNLYVEERTVLSNVLSLIDYLGSIPLASYEQSVFMKMYFIFSFVFLLLQVFG